VVWVVWVVWAESSLAALLDIVALLRFCVGGGCAVAFVAQAYCMVSAVAVALRTAV
jgi:formiminotetrahydrofolate cyclodeaminase